MKLGKLAPRDDPRTLRLSTYLPIVPVTPDSVNLASRVHQPWGMLANDTVGDCTIAAAAHWIHCATSVAWRETVLTTEQALTAYGKVSPYPARDTGAVELDVLKLWRTGGIGGHYIQAFADTALENEGHVRAALWLFEGLYIGLSLPITADGQDIWDTVETSSHDADPGSWGGHAVSVVGYDADGLTVVTWGALKRMTWEFWRAYCDESHVVLSADMLDENGLAVSCGFDAGQLQVDLAAVVIG